MPTLRRLGVYGANNPTKKSQSVVAADFGIAGLIGKFERKFDVAFACKSPQDVLAIFGQEIDPAMYGWDAVNGFFANAAGVAATLYIASHVGYTGSAIDAVQASQVLVDGTPATILTVKAAYMTNVDYGVNGNRTGVQVERGDRFATSCAVTSNASATSLALTSVAGIRKGDYVKCVCTGSGIGTVWVKVLAVNETLKTITIATIGAIFPAQSDVVTVPGFRIHTFRKSITGLETEVDIAIGKTWLTTESEVSDFYAPNVFANSSWLTVTVAITTPATPDLKFPVAVSTTVYPTNGADGTAPSTAAHWNRTLTRLDNLPVRMIANVETTDTVIQTAVETYAQGRTDNPKVIWNIAEARTKAQLITIGNGYQRSDAVLGVIPAQWLLVQDPFNSNGNAPYRHVPNGGHIMGLWVRCIAQKGVHWIPCTQDMPIYGAAGISGDQILDDQDRTDVAGAGVNCIQQLPGLGTVLRNMFTASTATEFMFANGLLMRDFVKVSAVSSLQSSENTPNSLNRIKEDKTAILNFLYRLWNVGSTGFSPLGEFFGQSQNSDGTPTKPEQHFEVQADLVNNPLTSINVGQRNLDTWFTYPTPAGSIRIGVGILLRS